VAPKLAKAVEKELATLGFKQAGFEAAIRPATGHDTPASAGPAGFDQCEFLFAPNPGEPARPLRAIASSGELARVMLALKTVLAAEDEVPVLVFDEVDANVGGETAHAVGDKMRRIAGNHQVLCITHLAPVAAYSAAHYVVTKDVQAGRTESRIFLLDAPGQVAELGRMLGGGPAAERHAAELLSKASAAS
jgi:DNA repair protein RecN (Recombination protein N)